MNFGGTGLNLTALDNSLAHFDFSGSGFATKTGWIAAGEGLLIKDNGLGGSTITPDELLGAQSGSGFDDLAALDSNADGVIDASDANFGQLKVWVDQNLDGVLNTGELKSMNDLGITSISLSRTHVGQTVNGNQVVEQATITINGAERVIAEVDFATSTIDTVYLPPDGFTYAQAALKLPQLAGYGTLANLHVSMSQNATLLTDVQNFVLNAGTMTGAAFDAGFEALLLEWAGVSGVDSSSRGPYVNAQHLAFVYAFYGIDPASQTAYAVDPNALRGPQWEDLYRYLVDQLEVRFASQVGLGLFLNGSNLVALESNPLTVFSEIGFNSNTDTITVNLDHLLKSIVQHAPDDPTEAQSYYDLTFRIVRGLRVDLYNEDTATFTAVVITKLAALGVSDSLEKTVAGAFGFTTVLDEASATGAISLSSTNGVVFVGDGDKALSGGSGNIYVYSASGGNDSISDFSGKAELVLKDLSASEVILQRPDNGADLVIVNAASGATLTIHDYFSNGTFKGIALAGGGFLTIEGVSETLRQEAITYLASASEGTDSPAQRVAKLASFGFMSVVDEGTTTANVGATNNVDVILIGTGDKTVAGGGNADIYVYSANGGNVTVDDSANPGGTSDLVLSDIDSTGVTLSRPGGGANLVLTVTATGKTVTVASEFFWFGTGSLKTVTFADGVAWTTPQIKQMLLSQESAASSGSVYGYYGDDTLIAGPGDKYLEGQGGTDTYVYSSSGGNDVIADDGHSVSTLHFSDIASTGVTLSRPGGISNLVMTVTATGKTVTVNGEFFWTGQGALKTITFADGVSWTTPQVKQMVLDQESAASSGSVYGYYGDDTLIAGPGDKYLEGQGGTDTYVYSSSGGNDVIADEGHSVSTLHFSDIDSTGVTLSRPGGISNLVMTVMATGKTVTVNGEFFWTGQGALNTITFADGVSWTTQQVKQLLLDQESAATGGSVYGYNGDDTLVAGPGDKYLQGQGGTNTYVYSSTAGNDVVDDEGHAVSMLQFSDIASTGVTLSRPGGNNDLVITVIATGKTVTVDNEFHWSGQGSLSAITFSDGVSWNRSQIEDILNGGSGAPVSKNFGRGDGQITLDDGTGIIQMGAGIDQSDILLQASGSDLIVKLVGTSDSITVHGDLAAHAWGVSSILQQLKFSDGSVLDIGAPAAGQGQPISFTWLGNSYSTLYGSTYGSNIFEISASNISVQFADAANVGGINKIEYTGGSGQSDVYLNGTTGFIELEPGISASDVLLQASGSDLILRVGTGSDAITVHGDLSSGTDGLHSVVGQIAFSDGTIWDRTYIESNAWIRGTSGGDALYGNSYADVLDGRGGNDYLHGGGGGDTYIYGVGSGNDTVSESSGDSGTDIVKFAGLNASAVTFSRSGSDLFVQINATSETLKVENQFNGTNGIEQIKFADGSAWDRGQISDAAWVRGTAAAETIWGTSDAEVFDGKGGDDTLYGQGGGDTYIFGIGSGNDTVSESSADTGTDIVKLAGLNSSDVIFNRSNNDLFVQIISSGETVKVANQFSGSNGIEQVKFADGSAWDRGQISDAAWVRGTAAAETIWGTSDAEVFDGKGGDDTLYGQGGGDTYIFGIGSGNDTVSESSADTGTDIVKLAGLNNSDVIFSRSGNDLLVQIISSAETLKVANQFSGSNGVELFAFADGSTWDRSQIADAAWVRGTAGNDTFFGSGDVEVFDGKGGNDYLHGGGGGDTYIYSAGSGNDTVAETSGDAGDDVVKLVGLNSSDIEFSRSGNDLFIQIKSSGEALKVENQFSGTNGVEQVAFADGSTLDRAAMFDAAWVRGTSGNDTFFGSSDAEVFDGKGGNDYLHGGGGGDTYLFGVGSGNDTVSENSGDSGDDVVKLAGLNNSDVLFSRSGNDLLIQINSSGETLKVENQFSGANGIEQVVFADGSTWDRAAIFNAAWVLGTSGNDAFFGSSDAEVFDGKGGNDYLHGGGGGDTYRFGVGSGNDTVSENSGDSGNDIIQLVDLTSSDVQFNHSGNDLLIQINATGETLRVENQFNGSNGIEEIAFSDGTTWDRTQIDSASWYRGTSGNDWISASSSDDVLFGGLGNDYLRGNDGHDTYIYASGHGNDEIDDESGSTTQIDTLKLLDLNPNDVTVSRAGNDLLVGINGTGETIKIDYQFYSPSANWGIEKIDFANGDSWDLATIDAHAWIRGTSGNDTISGSSWDDMFRGGLGDDHFSSGPGSDTYVYAGGDGSDYIDDESGSTTDVDTLHLTDLNASDLTFSRVGVNFVATVNSNGQTITFDEQFYSQTANWGIEKIDFANGDSWNLATINASAWIRGTSGNDTISGSSWDDTFKGGLGDDHFNSGPGSDTYVYASGDGNDYIDDESGSTTDVDTLQLTDLNASDLTFSRVGVNFVATVNSNGQTITFDEQFYSQTANWGIEKIDFANGDNWDLATINANAWIRGTSGNDTITGTSWDDTIAGGAGNDTLTGGAGDDTFVFRAGLGQNTVTDFTAGHDVLEFRDGVFADAAAALAAASTSGGDTIITIDATTSVLLQNVALANLHAGDFHIV